MTRKKGGTLFIIFTMSALFFLTAHAWANKSAVTITAPDSVAKGSEVVVKLTVTHNGNSIFHYTNWVYLKVNGKEVSRWEFTGSKRPESEIFIREYKLTVNEPLELTAEANCNIHGSTGPAVKKMEIK